MDSISKRMAGSLAAVAAAMALAAGPACADTQLHVGIAPMPEFVPVFIAMEKGFFKKRGLEVTPQIISNPANGTVALQADSLQVVADSVTTLLQASDSGLDLVVASGGAIASKTDTVFGVVAKTGSGIARPADLVGKKMGMPGLGSFFHVLTREWLTVHGVDHRKVKFVEVAFPQLADVMKAGTVDAIMTAEPFLTRATKTGIGNKTFLIAADLPDGLPPFVYIMRRDWALQHPGVAAAFQAAMAEAVAFADADHEAARAIYGRHVKLPPEALATIRISKMNATVTPAQLDLWQDMMRRQNMLRKPVDTQRLLTIK
nr:ABC transporter substrate-binding protein [uncultured Roseateles sp.]